MVSLYDSILSKYDFLVSTKIVPDGSISSEINVICAYGNLKSGTNEILYSDKLRFTDLDNFRERQNSYNVYLLFWCYHKI